MEGSPKFSLGKADVISILKGLGIAALSAVLTYTIDTVIPSLENKPGANLVLMTIVSVSLNTARKYLTNTRR